MLTTKLQELTEDELSQVSGGRKAVFYGLKKMYTTCPFCNVTKQFDLVNTSSGAYTIGEQMETCVCGAVIKAKDSSTVEFVKNGETKEASITG